MELTLTVISAAVVLLVAYDVWTLVRRGYGTTISWTVYVWSRSYPIIPFAFGVLAGHLFWVNVLTPPHVDGEKVCQE